MSKFLHGLLHVLAVLAGASLVGYVPAKYAPLVVAVQGALQTGLALANSGGANGSQSGK